MAQAPRITLLFAALTLLAPAAEPTLKERVSALFHEQKWAAAQAMLEQVVAAEPQNAEAYSFLGQTFLMRNQGEPAVGPLEKAVELAPANADYCRHLGDAYGLSAQQAGFFSKTGWALKCKAAYEKAVELDPKYLRARESLLEYYRQAPGFVGGGLDKAYAEAAEIQKLDPVRGRIAYAGLYASEKKYSEAFAQFDEVLRAAPDDYTALYQIGRLAVLSGQRLDDGLAALRRCLQLTPPAGQPGPGPTSWRIGNILERRGDKAGARTAYQAALKAEPNFKPAADSLKKLE